MQNEARNEAGKPSALPRVMVAVLALVALGGFAFSLLVGDRIVATGEGSAAGRGSFRPARGEGAPDFTLPDLNGEQVSLRGLRGKPVLLFFWTTW